MISTLTTLVVSGEPIVLTVAAEASTIDNNIISTVTQAAETSIVVSTWVTQQVSEGVTVTSASTLTLSGTSPGVGGTSQAGGAAAETSSNNTNTIIQMTGNPPVVPMIGAFLGGALFATLVMAVCLILLRRRRSRKRKRTAWIFNEPRFVFDERGGRGEKGNAREKFKSATDSDFLGPMSDPELDGTGGK